MKEFLVHAGGDAHRRVLLAERDAARRDRTLLEVRAELARTKLALQEVELEAAEYLRQTGRLEEQLSDLFSSLSWRLTTPVRRATALVNRLLVSLGGPPPKLLPGPAVPKQVECPPHSVLSVREQAILQRLQRQG